jgi:hypothetical protein
VNGAADGRPGVRPLDRVLALLSRLSGAPAAAHTLVRAWPAPDALREMGCRSSPLAAGDRGLVLRAKGSSAQCAGSAYGCLDAGARTRPPTSRDHKRTPAMAKNEGAPTMTITFTPNDKGNPPGKLANAELQFSGGPLDGLKLVGFSIWERRAGGRNVAFPARQYSVNGAAQLRAAAADRGRLGAGATARRHPRRLPRARSRCRGRKRLSSSTPGRLASRGPSRLFRIRRDPLGRPRPSLPCSSVVRLNRSASFWSRWPCSSASLVVV